MGLTKDALRPRSDAGRGKRSGVREDAARPRVIRRGIDCWESCYEGSGCPTTSSQTSAWEKGAACPGRRTSVGELRDVKRPACSEWQTGACRSCGLAVSQPCRRREEPVETTDAFRPTGGGRGTESGPSLSPTARAIDSQLPDQCPASEAINSNSPDGCPTGEGLITPTAGLDRGRRAKSTPSYQPALPAKDQRQLRFDSIPSWETGGERIILRSYPCNRDHAPRFLWSETLEKAKQ